MITKCITKKLLFFTVLLTISWSIQAQRLDSYIAAFDYKLVPMEANQLPQVIEQRGISVGWNRVERDEQVRLLGDRVNDSLVFHLVITNDSTVRILVLGRDINATRANEQVFAMNLPAIVEAVSPPNATIGQGIANATLGVMTLGVATGIRRVAEGDTPKQVRTSYLESSLHEKMLGHSILEPGESYQGLVIFDEDQWEEINPDSIRLSIQNLSQLVYLDFNLIVD